MTQVRKIAEEVNNGFAIKDWKNKILDIIRQNYRDEIPSEETIICYAADLIQDYHNTVKMEAYGQTIETLPIVMSVISRKL